MSNPAPQLTNATVARYALEVEIQASPAEVWQALTDDIGRWWPGPFFMCEGPGPSRMSLDARPGGHMHEDAGGGNGMIWGTVIHVQKGKVLELTGSYGSPLTWIGKYELSAVDGGTRLRFTESAFGHVTEAELAQKDHGWRFLYDGCLRAHLEGTEPPAWTDAPASSC